MFLVLFVLSFVTSNIFAEVVIDCKVPGEVNGIILTSENAADYYECLENCKYGEYCETFTYYETENNCAHFLNATSLDESCTTCVSGNRDCPILSTNCQVRGRCIGNLVKTASLNSEGECLQACKSDDLCKWYAFQGDIGNCLLLQNCLGLDTTCDDCSSGEKQCQIGLAPDFNFLMVIGGFSSLYIKQVELIDLTDQNRTCRPPADIPEPYGLGGMIATYINGQVIACGGINGNADSECYEYNHIMNTWSNAPSMLAERAYASANNLNDTHWLITGGSLGSGEGSLNSTEVYDSNEKVFYPSFDIGRQIYSHHQIFINYSTIIVTGGQDTTAKVNSFSPLNGQWNPMPVLNTPRYVAPSGLVTFANQTQAIVVAAGNNELTSEIFSLATQTWQTGPKFSIDIHNAAVVQYQNTFLVIGGFGDGYLKSIWKYDVESDAWIKMPQELAERKQSVAALLVPDSFCVNL